METAQKHQEKPADLWAGLRAQERYVLESLAEYFDIAAALATARTERLHKRYKEKTGIRQRISEIEKRIQEIAHEQVALRDKAAAHLMEKDKAAVTEILSGVQSRHAELDSEAVKLRAERLELQRVLPNFGGVPDSSEGFQSTNASERQALMRETDRLKRGLEQGFRDGRKRIDNA